MFGNGLFAPYPISSKRNGYRQICIDKYGHGQELIKYGDLITSSRSLRY